MGRHVAVGRWSIPTEQLGSAWTPPLSPCAGPSWLHSHRPTSSLVLQGPTSTWPSCRRAANPLVLTPQRVLPHVRVGPSITPPQIRPCSFTSTGPAALHALQYGAILAQLSQHCITGSAAAGGGDHHVDTHMGPHSSGELQGQGDPPRQRGQIKLGHLWVSHALGAGDSRAWVVLALGCPNQCFCAQQRTSSQSPRVSPRTVPAPGRRAEPGTLSLLQAGR